MCVYKYGTKYFGNMQKNLLSMRNISKWICEGSKTMVMGSNPAYGQGHLYNTVKKEEEVVPRNRGEE